MKKKGINIKENKWYWVDNTINLKCCDCGLIHEVEFSVKEYKDKKFKVGFKMKRINNK